MCELILQNSDGMVSRREVAVSIATSEGAFQMGQVLKLLVKAFLRLTRELHISLLAVLDAVRCCWCWIAIGES